MFQLNVFHFTVMRVKYHIPAQCVLDYSQMPPEPPEGPATIAEAVQGQLQPIAEAAVKVPPAVLNQTKIDTWIQREVDPWIQREVDARAIILFNVKPDQQACMRACQTADEMWDQQDMEYSLKAP